MNRPLASNVTALAPVLASTLTGLALFAGIPAAVGQGAGAEQIAFFESKIRPVLVEKCYKCHSVDAEKLKGGLLVDSKKSLLHGGDTGPAIELGDLDASLLIEALRYGDPDLEMPPKGKLPDQVIADFEKWVSLGAPWPEEPAPTSSSGSSKVAAFDLEKRRSEHWCWQPIQNPAPPAVADEDWPTQPLDQFILGKLEAKDFLPAEDAAPATWLRRVHFDLTGLPPTVDELAAFERVLAAVGDKATIGKGDNEKASAGGVSLSPPLLVSLSPSPSPSAPPSPTISPTEKIYANTVDSLLASPHFGERWARHWMDLARYGETCGHEFDYPIPAANKYRDYLIRAFNADLSYDQFVVEHLAGDQMENPRRHPDKNTNESIIGTGFWYLHESVHAPTDVRQWEADHIDNRIDAMTRGFLGLTVSCARCHDHKFDAIGTADYYALAGFLQSSRRTLAPLDPGGEIAAATAELNKLHEQADKILSFTSLPDPTPSTLRESDTRIPAEGWFAEGAAFTEAQDSLWIPLDPILPNTAPAIAHSGKLAARAEGALRSPTFELTQPHIHLCLKTSPGAKDLIVRLLIDGYDMNLVHTLLFKGSILKDKDLDTKGEYRWLTMSGDLDKYVGHRVYLEALDEGDGWIALDAVLLSSNSAAPGNDHGASGLNIKISEQLPRIAKLTEKYRKLAADFPKPDYVIAMIDGTPEDEHIFIRGSHKALGDLVPRRFLTALGGEEPPAPADASGRLQLAQQMTATDNPLLARVLVNRLWHHLFGRGIVPSVDDFGVMGQPPSHPDLLDHLATEFRTTQKWSVKSALRTIVLSRTYRMSSTENPLNIPSRIAEIDPDNLLLHRAPVRRLQAEAIRDAMLAVSGQLDPKIADGKSVPVHLTDFMEGRGRPKDSGPLEGENRRSIYLQIRRNFLNPMMLAFDMPSPFSAMGRRSVSNVPAQSLVLMNDPFVHQQAALWAESLLVDGSTSDRLTHAYRQAFARNPSPEESQRLLDFLSTSPDPQTAWTDICHILFNKKEFIYLR